MARQIVLMGVSGAGKSTVGVALAARLGAAFLEGDALHPQANIDKMHAGIALNDADRAPWLDAIGARLEAARADGESLVAACSALKHSYRDRLRAKVAGRLDFVLLAATAPLLADRLEHRPGHFMPASLLTSQLATLEMPGPEEGVLVLNGTKPVEDLVAAILAMPGGKPDPETPPRS